MRHGKKFNHLGRKTAHRAALLSNLAIALITHKRINTTLAKAKALRVYVEPLLTKSKENTTHNRRVVFSYLQNKEVLTELFSTVAEKIADRPGGYTRIIKTGYRLGDNAETCMIELVDFNEVYTKDSGEKSTTRRRRKKSGGASNVGAETVAPVVEEVAPVVEDVVENNDAPAEESTEDKTEA
jgi:large subunit ribosomal protein L17